MLSLTTAIQYDSVTFHSVSFVSAKFHQSTIDNSPHLAVNWKISNDVNAAQTMYWRNIPTLHHYGNPLQLS